MGPWLMGLSVMTMRSSTESGRGGWQMRIVAIGACLGCVLALSGCTSHSSRQLQALSAVGAIQQDAPVKATVTMQIAAPPAKVWDLLIDAPAWPSWCPQIESVKAPGELEMGTRLSGSRAERPSIRRCSWWSLIDASVGRARFLCTGDSRLELIADAGWWNVGNGEGVDDRAADEWLYSSDKLAASETDWLNALKQAAEKKP